MPSFRAPSVTLQTSNPALRARVAAEFKTAGVTLSDKFSRDECALLIVDTSDVDEGDAQLRVRSQWALVPAIQLSDGADATRRLNALKAGAADVLPRNAPPLLIVARALRLMASATERRDAIGFCNEALLPPSDRRRDCANIFVTDALASLLPTSPQWRVIAFTDIEQLHALASETPPDVIILGETGAAQVISGLLARDGTRHARTVAFTSDTALQAHSLSVGASDILTAEMGQAEMELRIGRLIFEKRLVDQARQHMSLGLDLSYRDALTGLRNRRFFDQRFVGIFQRARLRQQACSILMFDIDGFKQVNDRFGHAGGDAILKEFALRLRDNVRTNDLVARYGGEEFVVVMPDADMDVAALAADRVRAAIAAPGFNVPNQTVAQITVSVGVATQAPDDRQPEDVLARADAALFTAKGLGKNRVSRAA